MRVQVLSCPVVVHSNMKYEVYYWPMSIDQFNRQCIILIYSIQYTRLDFSLTNDSLVKLVSRVG